MNSKERMTKVQAVKSFANAVMDSTKAQMMGKKAVMATRAERKAAIKLLKELGLTYLTNEELDSCIPG